MSLKEKFFAVKGELRCEEYKLPDGSILYVRELSAREWLDIKLRSYLHSKAIGGADLLYDARVAAHSVTDANKQLVFDPHDDEELERLANEPDRTFGRLMAVVNRVNASGDEQHEQLKKSSESAPNSISLAPSPETPAA